MPHIEVNGKQIDVDDDGYIQKLEDWNEDVAKHIAKLENVELTPEHWDIINEARTYFQDNGSVAEPRVFSKIMKEKFGADRSSQQYIYSLFPYGLIKSANKIAGLPRPKGCS